MSSGSCSAASRSRPARRTRSGARTTAPVAVVHRAGPDEVERAIAGAVEAFATTRRLPSWQREQVLERISAGIAARRDELARTIALEAGKPIKTARVEVDRAVFTFRIAAEEAKRIYGEIVPLDWLPGNEGREARIRRVPLGLSPASARSTSRSTSSRTRLRPRSPPAIRSCCGPASQTPCSSLALGRIVLEAGWPEDAIAVLPCTTDDGAAARRGRPGQAAHVHRQPGGGLGPEGPRRPQAGDPRARRQRRGDRERRRGRRLRRRARRLGRLRLRGADVHLRAAGLRPRQGSTTSSHGSSSATSRRSRSATRWTRRRTSAR